MTSRLQQVEALVLQGMCHKDIARALGIELGTVKAYVSSLLKTRGAASMHQLTAMQLWARIRELEAVFPEVTHSITELLAAEKDDLAVAS